jgi:hypothetical protein
MSLKDVFLLTSPAPKPWCAECQQTVKRSEFSTNTFLCLTCEEMLLAQVRRWATFRAHDMAQRAVAQQRATPSLLNRVRREHDGRPQLGH